MKKRVGYVSDLHLEISNMSLDNPGWNVLVLAGDISQDFDVLANFFSYNLPEIPVIYVPGNHEYEGKRFDDVMPKLKEFEKDFPNLHVLQNKAITVEGIRFIGTTLWSNFEGAGIQWKEEIKKWAKQNIVDFSYIFKKNENSTPAYIAWNPDDMEKEFNKAYQFLKYELMNNPTIEPKFVVTHFAPHKGSTHKKYNKMAGNPYWVNNLPELMGFCDYWVHGHTHDSFKYEEDGTTIMCNPRGYSKLYDLSQNTSFDKRAFVEIEVPEPRNKIKLK